MSSNLVAYLIDTLKNTDKVVVYISKNTLNLETIHQNVLENIDLGATKASVILIQPMSIGYLRDPIDEAFFDNLSTSPDFLLKYLPLKNKENLYIVDPATLNFRKIEHGVQIPTTAIEISTNAEGGDNIPEAIQ